MPKISHFARRPARGAGPPAPGRRERRRALCDKPAPDAPCPFLPSRLVPDPLCWPVLLLLVLPQACPRPSLACPWAARAPPCSSSPLRGTPPPSPSSPTPNPIPNLIPRARARGSTARPRRSRSSCSAARAAPPCRRSTSPSPPRRSRGMSSSASSTRRVGRGVGSPRRGEECVARPCRRITHRPIPYRSSIRRPPSHTPGRQVGRAGGPAASGLFLISPTDQSLNNHILPPPPSPHTRPPSRPRWWTSGCWPPCRCSRAGARAAPPAARARPSWRTKTGWRWRPG